MEKLREVEKKNYDLLVQREDEMSAMCRRKEDELQERERSY